ncbi:tryptophan--tRNA ligase [Planctomycetales bacterium]|nr:tryptophan--tRNA ligase [Planctomycetales bacterium]
MQRILSGIQPTGRFHWGNYFGAIRQYIALQNGAETAFYFIANLHALTTVREQERLRQNTLDAALDLLALGLDPNQATLFVQSDVPEVSELCWILMTTTPMGLLERCHAYKDKKAKGLTADAGLFAYPVLMAADILMYDSNLVPVGEDQVQHIEVCRDIAGSFNHAFSEVFVLPKPYVVKDTAKVPGLDGGKMSKSYGNSIDVFEDLPVQKKKILKQLKTDSRPMEEPKAPVGDHLFELYSLFATEEKSQKLAETYRRGGFGYGDIKKELVELAAEYFAPARAKREELLAKPEYVLDVLATGAATARKKASEVLKRVQDACGVGVK